MYTRAQLSLLEKGAKRHHIKGKKKLNGGAQEVTFTTYTVNSFLEKAGVAANIKIWKKFDSLIRVKGTVRKLKPYKEIVYFGLSGGQAEITVKCPIDSCPKEGEQIIIEGFPFLKPSQFNTGLDLIIEGSPIGFWQPNTEGKKAPNFRKIDKSNYLKLHQFIKSIGPENLIIMGTDTAIKDVCSQIHTHKIETKIITFSDKEKIKKEIVQAATPYKGFAIARGGDDNSINFWNESETVQFLVSLKKPFYLAIGHTHSLTLADKYSDECFNTPSHLGTCIQSNIDLIDKERNTDLEIKKLRQDMHHKEKEFVITLETNNKSAATKEKIYLTVIAALAIACFLF